MLHPDPPAALAPYRVLDLTTEGFWLCGRILADLGADVIKVEPPGGDPGRATGPFARGHEGDRNASLPWWFANRAKRSVAIDLDDPAGRAELLAAAADADVLVESFGPGGLDARQVPVDALLAVNPSLVVTSISPFGLDGPYRSHRGPDLIIEALSGLVWLTGDPDRPPVRIGVPQSYGLAAAEAAVHTLVALRHAQRSGVGQHADVAAQAAAVRCLMNAWEFKALQGVEVTRLGSRLSYAAQRPRQIYRCADGEVVYMAAVGPLGGDGLARVRDWATADGIAVPAAFADLDVQDPNAWAPIVQAGDVAATVDAIEATVEQVFASRTKAELYDAAVAERYLLAPVSTTSDLLTDRQLQARDYWDQLTVDGYGTFTVPGPFAKLGATPILRNRPVPAVPEPGPVPPWRAGARSSRTAAPVDHDPFAGLKVLDLSWVGVGPLTARYLADYGATVLRVDNSVRADVLRVNPPFAEGRPGINRSQFYADFNASKLGIGIDLATEQGRELVLRLAGWADVVLESFTPKTLRAFGLDYEHLRAVNPRLVMLSTCMQGQTGPNADYRGFGQLMGGLTGFYAVTGWPDRDAALVYGAYTDFIAQRFCAAALMAAIDHQRRTGEGQHVDVSQLECSINLLGPALLERSVNGVVTGRQGNRDRHAVPHGIYPCRPEGDGPEGERWLAMACEDDGQWQALLDVLGRPEWATGEHLETAEGRRRHEDELDAQLARWTAPHGVGELVRRLQPVVAAAPVLSPDALHDDPQLQHLGYFVTLEHPVMGRQRYNGMQARLSVTPGRLRKAAPCVGEDTIYVLEELLGCTEDEVRDYLVSGAVEIELG